MPRTKGTPTRQDTTTPETSEKPPVRRLRVRHSGGTLTVDAEGTLGDLMESIEAKVGPVSTVSYRDASMATVTLLSGGEYPAGGNLAVGPDLVVAALFDGGETLNVSLETDKTTLQSTKKKKRSKEEPRVKQSASTTVEGLARDFVSASAGPESLLGTANHFVASSDGALRAEAATKQLIQVLKRSPKTISIGYRRTPKATPKTDDVRLLTLDECVNLVTIIMEKQSGSKRRRASTEKPATKLLTLDVVASRCPALFWSLYLHSNVDDSTPSSSAFVQGDVAYMLQHCIDAAIEQFKADNSSSSPADL